MYLDPALLAAIAALFTTATGGLGWLVNKLWSDRDTAQDKLIEMLRLQFGDATARKDLWDKLTQSVIDQGRVIDGLQKYIADLRDDIRRLKP